LDLENYRLVLSHWQNPNNIVLNGYEYKTSVLWDDSNFLLKENALLLYLDTLTYLPDDILTKIDRSSMSCSLEVRVPLIDHNIFEAAWRLPDEMKIKNNNLKLILKRILGKRMPEKLFDRPKMGFGVPIDLWLRGPLKSWAEQFINYDLIKKQGLLNADEIMVKWNSHQKNENWSYLLWNVIILQQWIKANPKIKI
jgi:asparagine synthase (glutamine-hydrolysing)